MNLRVVRRGGFTHTVRHIEGHGRTRSRRARRRQLWSRSGYGVLAGTIFVLAASASLLTSVYLIALI